MTRPHPRPDRPQRRPLRHWLLLVGLAVLWGSAFLGLKIAVESLPADAVVFLRLAIGVGLLLPLALVSGGPFPKGRTIWMYIVAMALVGNALPFFLIAWGQAAVPSSVAGVLMSIVPLAIVVLAHFLLPDERLTKRKAIGFLVGFCGLLVLFVGAGAREGLGAPDAMLRSLAILLAAFGYAVNVIISRRAPALAPVTMSAVVLFAAMALIAPFAVPDTLASLPHISARAAWAVIAVGVFPTALATLIYYEIVRVAGASFLALTNYLVPIWAVIVGATLGSEPVGWRLFAALGLVLIGIFVAERGKEKAVTET